MRYSRYLIINARFHQISCYKCKISSININQYNYAMWHWKRTWEPIQISINTRPQPKKRRIPRDTNFLQDMLLKQGSSLSLSLSLSLQARKLSLKEFFNNTLKTNQGTLQSIKLQHLTSQYMPKFVFLQSTNLGLITQINQVTKHQI